MSMDQDAARADAERWLRSLLRGVSYDRTACREVFIFLFKNDFRHESKLERNGEKVGDLWRHVSGAAWITPRTRSESWAAQFPQDVGHDTDVWKKQIEGIKRILGEQR
jgi:hypothetical protein